MEEIALFFNKYHLLILSSAIAFLIVGIKVE